MMAYDMSITDLPYEVLDHIVDHIDTYSDVLTVSLLSSQFHAITVPRHLEYRQITISLQDVSLWKHLAQRPDLAANVRRLTIATPPIVGVHNPKSLIPLLSGPQYKAQQMVDDIDPQLLLDAMAKMTHLKFLEVDVEMSFSTFKLHPTIFISHVLRSCRYLEHFDLFNLLESEPSELATSTRLPISSLFDLNTMVLFGPSFNSFLSLSKTIQVLVLPAHVGYDSKLADDFSECHFLNLLELTLNGWHHTFAECAVQFLQAHPTVERLTWRGQYTSLYFKPLPGGLLPALRHLRADTWSCVLAFLSSIDDQTRSLESIYSTAPLFDSPTPHANPTLDPRIVQGRGRTLRRLHTPCPDVITLRALAELFPAVTHLHISCPGLSSARLPTDAFWRLVMVRLGASRRRLDSGQPRMQDALALFPELEVVGQMKFKNSKGIRRLLASYPRLRGCEDPQFPS